MDRIRFLSVRTLIVGLILIVAACSSSPNPQLPATPTVKGAVPIAIATATPTPEPTLFGGASAILGPVPQTCPTGPTPRSIDGNFGAAVGGSAVWGIGFAGPYATLEWLPEQASETHHSDGWDHKLLWVVQNNVKGLVRIHGANLSDSSPIYPDAEQEETSSTPTEMVLNPQNPDLINQVDQWDEFPGGLDISKAGCYYLEASWPGGSWRITFAAGVVSS